MPNGIDKNWYRMCAAINGFRARYDSWPTKIHLPEGAIRHLFSEETLEKLQEKLAIIYDDSPYVAEDDLGRSYNYGREGFYDEPPDIQAREWLDVEPDSEMVKEYYTPLNSSVGEDQTNEKPLPIGLVIALRFFFGGLFAVPGLLLIGSSLGLMDIIPWASKIPIWGALLTGLPFVSMGAMIAAGLKSFGEEDTSVSPEIKLVLLLSFLAPLALIFLWAGFGPGEREFTVITTVDSTESTGAGDELTGRILFGGVGIFMAVIALLYIHTQFIRKNKR